jgi:hypothetical protein
MKASQKRFTIMIHIATKLGFPLLGILLSAPSTALASPSGWSGRFELAEPGIPMSPNEWTLGPLTEGSGPPILYFYPQTSNPVRLYLIDTAVKHTATWFAQNSNLNFTGTVRLPSGSSKSFKHGTRMLSIIAGPETGAALGTPIEVVNYDVYPKGEGTNTEISFISSAVGMAHVDHLTSSRPMPAVICIAGGSINVAESYILKSNINSAVAAGITVVVSAGNLGVDVSNGYIPAIYGLDPGVICVGANGENGLRLPTSNFGEPVDLYAPGEDIRTLRFLSPKSGAYEQMTGTSPAAGLATAAALIQLSLDPGLTPAQVEQALTGEVASPALAALKSAEEEAALLDSDSDGIENTLETFFGSDPNDAASCPKPIRIEALAGMSRLTFSVAADLFDAADPHFLSNGNAWRVQVSTDLGTWKEAEGTMTSGPEVDGVVPITFDLPNQGPKGFLRIEVTAQVSAE